MSARVSERERERGSRGTERARKQTRALERAQAGKHVGEVVKMVKIVPISWYLIAALMAL